MVNCSKVFAYGLSDKNKCCIFRPMFGYCALRMLVEICFYKTVEIQIKNMFYWAIATAPPQICNSSHLHEGAPNVRP